MREVEIRQYADAAPFFPFRLYVSDGSSYEVTARHHIVVNRSRVSIGLEPDEIDWPHASVLIDPIHVTRIQTIRHSVAPADLA